MCYCHKEKPMEENREPRNKHVYDFQQRCQDHSMGKGQSFWQTVLGNWISTCKGMKVDPFLTLNTKIN